MKREKDAEANREKEIAKNYKADDTLSPRPQTLSNNYAGFDLMIVLGVCSSPVSGYRGRCVKLYKSLRRCPWDDS